MTRAALLEPLLAEANIAVRFHKAAEASGISAPSPMRGIGLRYRNMPF
jgi:hypothetical protein